MPRIFVCYRRAVSAGQAGRLYDRLKEAFGSDNVFMDIESIPVGETFESFILSEIERCDYFLMVLSQGTLDRIFHPGDYIHLETAHALKQKYTRVIPVLVDGFQMPRASDLPEDIAIIANRNAEYLRHELFAETSERIIKNIRNLDAARLIQRIEDLGIELIEGSQSAKNLITELENYLPPTAVLSEIEKHLVSQSNTTISIPINVVNADGKHPNMVYVPSGYFLAGDDELLEYLLRSGWDTWRLPQKAKERVEYTKGFWIDIYPVTIAEYKKFIDATGYEVPYLDEDRAQGYNWDQKTHMYPDGKENHPVVLVSWDDACEYAKWAGKRLPTEPEWEKAARGTDGRKYPWGNKQPDRTRCNIGGQEGGTTPVDKYVRGRSPYGCYDMAGNVWNWCQEPHPLDEDLRVMRGSSWDFSAVACRCAFHDYVGRDEQWNHDGFRCVMDI